MIENFGTGIPRTIDSYKNYNVKPEFNATENFFFVTLPNINYYQNESIKESINESINDIGLEILKIVKNYPGINIPNIVLKIQTTNTSVTKFKVKNEIQRNLTNYVEHRGSNKTGGYYLKDRIHK